VPPLVTSELELDEDLPTWLKPYIPPGFRRLQLPARIGVVMQKGGVGKTTTATSLGADLAMMGYRVRVWDADAQGGSSSTWIPGQYPNGAERRPILRDLFFDEATVADITRPTRVPRLFMVNSGGTKLLQVEHARPVGAELALRHALDQDAGPGFDIEVFDCGPTLGLLTVSVLAAVQHLIIPIKPSGLDQDALQELYHTIEQTRAKLNPELTVAAVVLSEAVKSNLTMDFFDQMVADFPDAITMAVRMSVRAREATIMKPPVPLHEYAPDSTTRQDLRWLAGRLFAKATAA
jgi:chromosome partitioning protein